MTTWAGRPPRVDVRRAGDRFATKLDWLDSHHSFSFGQHYDPDNTGHGLLVVHNDDVVRAGNGFDTHPHRDMEIVTWVLQGALQHEDSTGRSGVIVPGSAQRMSAGRGILHSERNDVRAEPVHYLQMWVMPDESGLDPGYEQFEIGDELDGGVLVPLASGMPRYADSAAVSIASRSAALHAAQLRPGGSVLLPDAPFLHLFVSRGSIALEGTGRLEAGDAVRFTAIGGSRVTAAGPAEILVWEMHAALG